MRNNFKGAQKVLSKHCYLSDETLLGVAVLKAMVEYTDKFKVNKKKKSVKDRDKKSAVDSGNSKCTQAFDGISAVPADEDFLSAKGKPTPMGAMDSNQNVKVCDKCGTKLTCSWCDPFNQPLNEQIAL